MVVEVISFVALIIDKASGRLGKPGAICPALSSTHAFSMSVLYFCSADT